MTEEDLMEAYKNGDEAAFIKLYEMFSSRVYSYARKRLNPSEADDFYQSVWKHLHEKKSHYSNQPFTPWFFVLIRNLLTDEYRSRGRKKELLNKYEESFDETNSQELNVREILDNLPLESGRLIKKYYLEGYSYEDLEKEMGLSQISLRKRLSRAMTQLKKVFED